MKFIHLKKEITITALLAGLFLLASYYSQMYVLDIVSILGGYGSLGMLMYVFVSIIATVIAPVSFLPLLPISVALWGSFVTAILSIIGWTVGSAIAFLLARRFGKPLVRHFVGDKVNIFSKLIPHNYIFFAVVILRMFLPVDLLSYALGLFSDMQFWPYMLATIIGTAPFAFIFSYMVTINIWYQVALFALTIVAGTFSFPYIKKRYNAVFFETHTDKKA